MPKPDRFGSPFDPNNKLPLPGSDKSEKLEQEVRQVQLRWCGDPRCAMCNPETAAMSNPPPISRASLTGRRPTQWPTPDSFDAALRSALGRIDVQFSDRRISFSDQSIPITFYDDTPASKPATKEPPKSYSDAREAVEKWLITAPEQSFDDIFGNEEALEQLRDAIQAPVTHKELYEAYGMKMPKGALLSGPPGCGKTMFARAAASEIQKLYGGAAEFLCINSSDIQSPYVGVTEGHISAIFKFAREYKAHHGHRAARVFADSENEARGWATAEFVKDDFRLESIDVNELPRTSPQTPTPDPAPNREALNATEAVKVIQDCLNVTYEQAKRTVANIQRHAVTPAYTPSKEALIDAIEPFAQHPIRASEAVLALFSATPDPDALTVRRSELENIRDIVYGMARCANDQHTKGWEDFGMELDKKLRARLSQALQVKP